MDPCKVVTIQRVVISYRTKKVTGIISDGIIVHIGKAQARIFLLYIGQIYNKPLIWPIGTGSRKHWSHSLLDKNNW